MISVDYPSTSRRCDHQPCGERVAMTFTEMILTVFVIGVGLFLIAGWMSNQQRETKTELARRMLADIDVALTRYRRATGSYPRTRGPESAIPAVVDLLDHDKTREILEAFPFCLRSGPGRQRLVDPWGSPLRYLAADSGDPIVKANGGRPVFVSAGPDGDFGDGEPAYLGDNLRSDDPGPNGFRLEEALRDVFADEDLANGQKGDQ